MVAEVDESKSNEFRDIQYFHITETGKASANAGEQRTNGNEDVAEETGSSLVHREILDGRVNSTAKKKNEGIEVEQGRKCSDPLPCKHSPGEAVIEALRNFNRRGQHTNGGNENGRRTHHGRDIGKAFFHKQVDGSLGQGVSAQQCTYNVPNLGVPFAPAEDGIDAFRERAKAEGEYAQGPPQQVRRPPGEVVWYDAAQKENRKERRENWNVTDHISSRGLNLERELFYTLVAAQINETNCSEIRTAIRRQKSTCCGATYCPGERPRISARRLRRRAHTRRAERHCGRVIQKTEHCWPKSRQFTRTIVTCFHRLDNACFEIRK